MADKKATLPAKKTLGKKAMKSVKGGGGLIVDRQQDIIAQTTEDCRKAGGTGTDY